jgi:aspartyl aminopeptidase
MENNIKELIQYLDNSLTAYQAVNNAKTILENNGFKQLYENKIWTLDKDTNKYFVIRNDSSIMAFTLPTCKTENIKGYHIYAAHSDSPAFKIKENPEMEKEGIYVTLNTEKYGGMIYSTWLDRPLTIAGRVCIDENGEIKSYPIKLKDNICMMPNLAIHMNRDMNDGVKLNPQTDLIPLITLTSDNKEDKFNLKTLLAEELTNITATPKTSEDILSYDLFVENSEKATIAGANDEFIMSARYDDLACAFAGLKAITQASSSDYINLLAIFDNEEVGSLTRQGADSTFLKDTLENIADTLGITSAKYRTQKSNSFMLSADNAHAMHPNQSGKADPTNRPIINKGVVLKHHGSQKYSTDAYSAAYVKKLCKDNDIPLQTYANRSDIAGGSTLGNLAMAQVSMPAADIGLPQLAMHSAYETAGVTDLTYLVQLAKAFMS